MYPQRYSLILWANPKEETEAETAQLTYSLLKLLDGYGDGVEPRYLPGQRKSAVKPFELTFDNVLERLRASINEEGGRVFYDLGHRMGFFSSFEGNKTSRISLSVGTSNKRFINSLIVKLPESGFSGFDTRLEEFVTLFKELVELFDPFWGAVTSSITEDEYEEHFYRTQNKPSSIHWLNYFDEEVAEGIGRERLATLPSIEKLKAGYFYRLQSDLFDAEDPEQVRGQKEMNIQLGLTTQG